MFLEVHVLDTFVRNTDYHRAILVVHCVSCEHRILRPRFALFTATRLRRLLRNAKYTPIVIPAYLLRGSHRNAGPFNRISSDCPPTLIRGSLSPPNDM